MTAYQVGKRFEDKIRDHLRADGYEVIRSAGSKTKVDLIAFKPGQLLFIQAKRDGACTATEWDRLVEIASWAGAIPVLAVNGPAGRGVTYWRLLGHRIPRAPMGQQPAERFLTDEVLPTAEEVRGILRQEWVEG